jgi:transposase-like protein
MQVFEIDNRHIEAAQLITDGELTYAEIARRVGVTYQTLWSWRRHKEFVLLVAENRHRFEEEIGHRGLANQAHRIKALNGRWNRMQQIIEARANHPDYADIPGGRTGLLVKTVKQIGSGDSARLVEEFALDVALLKELRAHEKQAAMEMDSAEEQLGHELNELNMEELAARTTALLQLLVQEKVS